jgi:hypothetical protein
MKNNFRTGYFDISKAGMGNFEISGINNLFRHEKIASWS